MNFKKAAFAKRTTATLVLIGVSFCSYAEHHETKAAELEVPMIDTKGKAIGTLTLTETANGVLITGELEGISKGEHAFHIHETGSCDVATGFKSAGGHLSGQHSHGYRSSEGPHPGDMSNIHVMSKKAIEIETFNAAVTLGDTDVATGQTSLLDDDGTAIVIHEGADDYESQPSGAAGSRVACGVIMMQEQMSSAAH
ncbi:superoxide dismutase family protein [Halioxenophilus aromaticivorans]|uniref:Superoxide dismutase family protein n=1 Tax=Halioxenophilus aromaticivorans TaxID=1306992 RepID=A0AAV3U9T5_9ALTE